MQKHVTYENAAFHSKDYYNREQNIQDDRKQPPVKKQNSQYGSQGKLQKNRPPAFRKQQDIQIANKRSQSKAKDIPDLPGINRTAVDAHEEKGSCPDGTHLNNRKQQIADCPDHNHHL